MEDTALTPEEFKKMLDLYGLNRTTVEEPMAVAMDNFHEIGEDTASDSNEFNRQQKLLEELRLSIQFKNGVPPHITLFYGM